MVYDNIKKLEVARANVAALEKSITSELNAELSGLPTRYGFDSVKAFVAAVKLASHDRRGRRSVKTEATLGKKRRSRAVITDETRASVKKMVGAGKTGHEISKALKISLPSVQNIKKALGLVKKR